MKCPVIIVFVYGLLVLAGGIFGYVKADSLPSLFMGSGFAILLIASAYTMTKNHKYGSLCALVLSTILTLFFGFRYIKMENFMPNGLMSILSLLVVAALLYSIFKNCKGCCPKNSKDCLK
jgi:uncharacterized membrane protein (UPF0136 family)